MSAVRKGAPASWAAGANFTIDSLSHDPPIHLVRGFLSTNECQRLVKTGKQLGMEEAECFGPDCMRTGSSVYAQLETPTRKFAMPVKGKTVRNQKQRTLLREVQDRIARLILPAPALVGESRVVSTRQAEPLQLQRYGPRQFYKLHLDHGIHHEPGYHRVATVLLYLTSVPEAFIYSAGAHLHGGHTAFPHLRVGLNAGGMRSSGDGRDVRWQSNRTGCDLPVDAPRSPQPALDAYAAAGMNFCSCPDVLGVQPRQGDALVFYPGDPASGTADERLWHGSCPLFEGTKWTAQQWWHSWREARIDESELDKEAAAAKAAIAKAAKARRAYAATKAAKAANRNGMATSAANAAPRGGRPGARKQGVKRRRRAKKAKQGKEELLYGPLFAAFEGSSLPGGPFVVAAVVVALTLAGISQRRVADLFLRQPAARLQF